MDVSSSTGGGGRTMSSYQWDLYDWTVQHSSDEPDAELDDVIEASASGGSSELTIPSSGRLSEMSVTWFFNVTATNWLGGVGWNAFEVSRWRPNMTVVLTNTTVVWPLSDACVQLLLRFCPSAS